MGRPDTLRPSFQTPPPTEKRNEVSIRRPARGNIFFWACGQAQLGSRSNVFDVDIVVVTFISVPAEGHLVAVR